MLCSPTKAKILLLLTHIVKHKRKWLYEYQPRRNVINPYSKTKNNLEEIKNCTIEKILLTHIA